MDKFEYQAKLEEINKLLEKDDYEEAARIADTIEWKRVRSVRTLCMVSEIYEAIGRVEDSKAILYRAYRRSPNSRQILYRLTEACVQTQDFDDAVEYYTEYVNLSPNDNSKYILKYEIYKGRGSSLEEQIEVLEEYKSREYTEKWAYELAKLYDEAGMGEHCVAECDDLALWFHNGKYVVQALELKQKYMPLTPEQQTIYDNPSEIVDMETKEAVVEAAVPTLDVEIMKEMPKSEKDVIADSIIMNTEKEIAAAVAEHREEPEPEKAAEKPELKSFDTVGLQNELANSMREILAGLKPASTVDELEKVPVLTPQMQPVGRREEREAAELPQEEEQIQGQMSIDDLLTSTVEEDEEPEAERIPAAEQRIPVEPAAEPVSTGKEALDQPEEDILSAATINISDRIRKEIGDRNLREYAASQAAGRRAQEQGEALEAKELTAPRPAKPAADALLYEEPEEAYDEEDPEDEIPGEEEEAEDAAAENAGSEAGDRTGTPAGASAEEARQAGRAGIDPESYTRNGLDEMEKRMLGFWSSIRGMNEQIDAAVTQVMRNALAGKTSSKGNMVLVGDAGNGRTTLALGLAKIISRCKGQQTVKVAKIYAEDLNSKDIAATINKIAGGVLIIEEAGDLEDNTIAQLSMAMDFKTDSLVVILEDERRYLQDLLARNPQFSQKFTITLNVPTLTNDELVEFGKYYARDKEYVLDDSAALALYDGIGAMQTSDQPVAILDVKEMVDKALKNANRFGVRKLFSTISGKRYDDQNRIIVSGRNFKKIK